MQQDRHITAVYPGTFDPVTNGHLDIIARSANIFSRVIVAVLKNYEKEPFFSSEQRVEMLSTATAAWPNVDVESFGGLLVNYVGEKQGQVIVRGIRAVSDYEYELQMASMNRRLDPNVETVFMFPGETYSYLSSRLVREICQLGGSVRGLVPKIVEKILGDRADQLR